MADKPKFHTWATGTHVSWGYRGTRGHGVIVGVHVLGKDNATTEYAIRELDHHVSASGSKEPTIVYHYGADMAVESA